MPIFKFDGSKLMFLHLITNKSFELKRFKLTITTFLPILLKIFGITEERG